MVELLHRAGPASALALLLAIANWVALARGKKHVELVLKPATMLAVIYAALEPMHWPHDVWQAGFFLAGLALCLVGDIVLILPGESFLPGLVAFLFAHGCYTAGLTPTLPPPATLVIAFIVALIGLTAYRRIASGLRRSRKPHLVAPVATYIIVIGLMVTTAWATLSRPEWTVFRRALVVAGASLFAASDTILAWDLFVTLRRSRPVAVMATYHLAQIAPAASIALVL